MAECSRVIDGLLVKEPIAWATPSGLITFSRSSTFVRPTAEREKERETERQR